MRKYFSNQPDVRVAAIRAGVISAGAVAIPLLIWHLLSGMAETLDIERFALGGALVALAGVAGMAFSGRMWRWRTISGFELISEQAPDAYFLTEKDSTLIAANPAARDLLSSQRVQGAGGTGHRANMLGQVLQGWSDKAEEFVYRLSRSAAEKWGAAESPGGSCSDRIKVRKVGPGLLMWRIEGGEPGTALTDCDIALPVVHITADGVIRSASQAFLDIVPALQRAIAEAAAHALAEGRVSMTVDDGVGSHFTLAIAPDYRGDARVFVLDQRDQRGETLNKLLEDLPVALVRMDAGGAIVSANAAARNLLGARATAGALLEGVVEGFGRPIGAQVRDAAAGRGAGRTEQARGRVEGRDVFLQIALTRAPDAERGELIAVLSDATELKTLEQQFVQSQKMQAVGQMAGGVAHDFNNLLTAIIGHCDLLMLRTDQAQPAFADLTQIKQNANRAAALVRQLLAFSRKQTLKPKPASLSDTLNELSHLLNRLLGERVRIELDHAFDLWPVWIDERQFEQVIVNLAVNARDAMPEGGAVSVRCWNRVLSEPWQRDRAAVPAGDYVCIKVSDTGTGMDEVTMSKVFEPFFTTKRQGEGTGLGLSTAYGIVKQMDGFIFVDSVPGQGTTFTILLPRMHDAPEIEASAPLVETGDLTGSGSILLVEDEAPVRAFAARALRLRGYEVVEADCAEAALTILEDTSMRIDLMISDVVMPGMDGPTWVRSARLARPDVGVIFISGYAEGVFRNGMEDLDNYTFLAKPFVLDELAAAVKKAMPQKDVKL
ncbi:MAG: ATP-binding protein [Pikeienuella sp.]